MDRSKWWSEGGDTCGSKVQWKRIFPVQHANESNGVPLGENENKYSFCHSWRNHSWSKILLCTVPWLGHGPRHRLSNHLIKPLLGNTQGIQGLDGKCSSCSMSSVLEDLLSTGHEQNTSPGRIPGGILTKWLNRSGGSLSCSPYLYASAQPPSGGNLFQLLVFMILPAALSFTQLRELRNSITINTNL